MGQGLRGAPMIKRCIQRILMALFTPYWCEPLYREAPGMPTGEERVLLVAFNVDVSLLRDKVYFNHGWQPVRSKRCVRLCLHNPQPAQASSGGGVMADVYDLEVCSICGKRMNIKQVW